MKETKVYIDDETLMKCERYRHNSCPIIKTHDHDKELVEKVLNRVKKELDGDYNQYRINYILDQIQKEFEDGE